MGLLGLDRKSTRLNSSHLGISYAVFCLRLVPTSTLFPYRRSSDLDTRSSSRLIVRAATAALLSFAILLPANAQFWGDSWGGRQQQSQRPYNPYGGFGGDRQWDYWDYRQRQRPPSYQREQRRERSREVEKDQPPDYYHVQPAAARQDPSVKIVVMGDANADWLAYGLEDAFSEKTEIGIVRKHRTDSGLIHYDQRRDGEWPQVAREIIAAEKPKFIVMMIGNNDRQTIREKVPPAVPPQRAQAERAGGKSASMRNL